ncbi:MAG: MFS transporter, partial [candidate division Zixibacteria bacterium]|nr:MFS transporter [candidate division Zixibacteria bacterium]
SFLAGSLASKIGTPATVAFGGITCIIGAIIFLKSLPQLRKSMRPIYVRKGIIPEVAEGLQAAANISNRPQN